jgi:transcriptional regulator with XRE-family HTH domain
MNAAELIRATRRRNGLSQASLARRSQTSQRHISRIEGGDVSPSVDTLGRLLRAMGERLELAAVPGPRANASTTELRAAVENSRPGERFAEVAELSELLTSVRRGQPR